MKEELNLMIEMLSDTIGTRAVDALGFLLAFALTALMDSMFRERLPHDHGRAFAVNGELSKGKARGSGLIFVLCIALVTLAVIPFRVEYLIYTALLIASMLSGYFDDAADTAWNEYKKGLIDFVIAVVAGVTYLNFNGTGVQLLNWAFSIPYPVYLLLIVVLIWASINVVNCTDGVDGLSASLAVVSIGTFLLAYWEELGEYATAGVIFIGALLAYLWSNAKPSTLLMGGRRQPRHGLLPGHPGPQEQSPVRIPAGGTGLYRGRQSGHPQNQLQAVFAHQHPEKNADPAARPCAQADGLER